MIKSAEAVRSLSDEMEPMGSKITNERTARAVAQVAPEVRVEVVREASEVAKSEGRPMTARDVPRGIPDVLVFGLVASWPISGE